MLPSVPARARLLKISPCFLGSGCKKPTTYAEASVVEDPTLRLRWWKTLLKFRWSKTRTMKLWWSKTRTPKPLNSPIFSASTYASKIPDKKPVFPGYRSDRYWYFTRPFFSRYSSEFKASGRWVYQAHQNDDRSRGILHHCNRYRWHAEYEEGRKG